MYKVQVDFQLKSLLHYQSYLSFYYSNPHKVYRHSNP